MTLGERIFERRKALKYSRSVLCGMVGISVSQLVRYENDTAKPTADVIVALAYNLSVTTDWLLGAATIAPGEDNLTELERQAVGLMRSRSRESQLKMIELWRVAFKI